MAAVSLFDVVRSRDQPGASPQIPLWTSLSRSFVTCWSSAADVLRYLQCCTYRRPFRQPRFTKLTVHHLSIECLHSWYSPYAPAGAPPPSSTRSISPRNQLSHSASNASGSPSHYTRLLPLALAHPCPASRTPYRALNLRLSWNSTLPHVLVFPALRSLPMFSARGGRPVGPAAETTSTRGKFKPLLPPAFAPPPLDHRLPPRTPVHPQIKGAISRESNYAS